MTCNTNCALGVDKLRVVMRVANYFLQLERGKSITIMRPNHYQLHNYSCDKLFSSNVLPMAEDKLLSLLGVVIDNYINK